MGHAEGYNYVLDRVSWAEKGLKIPLPFFFREKIIQLFVESKSCVVKGVVIIFDS